MIVSSVFFIIFLNIASLSEMRRYDKQNSRLFISEEKRQELQQKWASLCRDRHKNTANKKKLISPNKSIVVVSLSTANRTKLASYTLESIQRYCFKQNYPYFEINNLFDISRHPNWNKILAVRYRMNLVSDETWVVWFDDDMLITDPEVRLEDFIALAGNEKSFIISEDIGIDFGIPINTGIFLIRNNKLMRNFLDEVWVYGALNGYFSLPSLMEQQSATDLILNNNEYAEAIEILPNRLLQSYIGHDGLAEKIEWQEGDFLAHLAGVAYEKRLEVLSIMLKKKDPFKILHI